MFYTKKIFIHSKWQKNEWMKCLFTYEWTTESTVCCLMINVHSKEQGWNSKYFIFLLLSISIIYLIIIITIFASSQIFAVMYCKFFFIYSFASSLKYYLNEWMNGIVLNSIWKKRERITAHDRCVFIRRMKFFLKMAAHFQLWKKFVYDENKKIDAKKSVGMKRWGEKNWLLIFPSNLMCF